MPQYSLKKRVEVHDVLNAALLRAAVASESIFDFRDEPTKRSLRRPAEELK
jgi:hypothetical protein